MKLRTMIVAGMMTCLGVLLLLCAALFWDPYEPQVFAVIGVGSMLIGWIGLLLRQRWAWWALVVVFSFLSLVSLPDALSDVVAASKDSVVLVAAYWLFVIIMPLATLLTDRPRHWRPLPRAEQVQEAGFSVSEPDEDSGED